MHRVAYKLGLPLSSRSVYTSHPACNRSFLIILARLLTVLNRAKSTADIWIPASLHTRMIAMAEEVSQTATARRTSCVPDEIRQGHRGNLPRPH